MPRKEKQYHFIYKTTNLLNGKFYIGMHSTDDLNDGYIGSGRRLWRSINKYGKENHKFEILEFLNDRKSLANREAEIINEELIANPLCMNLKLGGEGGWEFVNGETWLGKPNIEKHFNLLKTDAEYAKNYSQKCAERNKTRLRNKDDPFLTCCGFAGKHHSEETKQKMRKSKNVGESNSQFGTCWINNGVEAKKIKKEELQVWIEQGWNKGRKFNTAR